METINLKMFMETQEPQKIRTILTCSVRLDKKTIIEILSFDRICIYDHYFKTPKEQLLECLKNDDYGETRLELEQID